MAKKTAKKSSKKNSLVNNINKRKAAGKSRPKSKSTVSKKAYGKMQSGWKKRGQRTSSARGRTATMPPTRPANVS